MSDEKYEREEQLNRVMADGLDAGPIPAKVQAKLEETYASLGSIPQDRPTGSATSPGVPQQRAAAHARSTTRPSVSTGAVAGSAGHGGRVVRRGMVVAVAAVAVVLLSGVAFAASRLVQMGPGDVSFFESGQNLAVFDSMQAGVSSLNAPVGETVTVDGVNVTLDSVSSDRSIINVFLTMEKVGGFDLDAQSVYDGSQENEWVRLQRIAPSFLYSLTSNGEAVDEGSTSLLDAYREDGKVKCMLRIVPEAMLPDQVDMTLNNGFSMALTSNQSGQPAEGLTFSVGLDLTTVTQPANLGTQDLTFQTSAGEKTLGIMRFTHSELGTVMVARNDSEWSGEEGKEGSSYGPPASSLAPNMLKITDDKGNVLTPVSPGDGGGYSAGAPYVIEFAGMASDATSVTFTPMVSVDFQALTVDERKALNEPNEGKEVDVTQIGTKFETSEYGGFEITGREVSDGTVSITYKPYGWVPDGRIELIPDDENITLLASTWTNPDTGETGTGYHSGIVYTKQDYATGESVQMTSYYAATDEELQGLTLYHYYPSFGIYTEDADATITAQLA